jgi:hypothetical protein
MMDLLLPPTAEVSINQMEKLAEDITNLDIHNS